MVNRCNAYAQVTRYSRSFCSAVRYHEPLFEVTLTGRRSFYAYRIYIRKFYWYFFSDGSLLVSEWTFSISASSDRTFTQLFRSWHRLT
jgi:hypothetical protein